MRNRWNALITDQAFYNRSSFLSCFKSNHLARHPAVTCHFLDCSPHLINVTQISGSFRKYQWHRWISSIPIANSYKHLSYSWSVLQLKPHSIPKLMREIVSSLNRNNCFPIEIGSNNRCNAIFDFGINGVIRFAMPGKSQYWSQYTYIWFRILTTYLAAIDFEIEICAHSI